MSQKNPSITMNQNNTIAAPQIATEIPAFLMNMANSMSANPQSDPSQASPPSDPSQASPSDPSQDPSTSQVNISEEQLLNQFKVHILVETEWAAKTPFYYAKIAIPNRLQPINNNNDITFIRQIQEFLYGLCSSDEMEHIYPIIRKYEDHYFIIIGVGDPELIPKLPSRVEVSSSDTTFDNLGIDRASSTTTSESNDMEYNLSTLFVPNISIKKDVIANIKKLLNECESVRGIKNKVFKSTDVFWKVYQNMWLCRYHPRFYNTLLKKLKEFENDLVNHSSDPEIITNLKNLIENLGPSIKAKKYLPIRETKYFPVWDLTTHKWDVKIVKSTYQYNSD
jgi:hypothetical protein